MVVVELPKQFMLVAVIDFYLACVAPVWDISLQQFKEALQNVHTSKKTSPFKPAQPADLRVIKKHSPKVKARTTCLSLCSLKLVHRALVRLQALTPQLTAEFQQLFDRSCHLQKLSVHQLDPNQEAMQVGRQKFLLKLVLITDICICSRSCNISIILLTCLYSSQRMVQPLPAPAAVPHVLPKLPLTSKQIFVGQYGLSVVAPALVNSPPLVQDLEGLLAYLQADFVLNRPPKVRLGTNGGTWAGKKSLVHGFMGFLYEHYHHVPLRLSSYRDHFQAFTSFISFLNSRLVEGAYFYNHCNMGELVLFLCRSIILACIE